jgi:hypothetical protein
VEASLNYSCCHGKAMSFRSPPTVRMVTKTSGPTRKGVACRARHQSAAIEAQYNYPMADRIACSCVTCPKCGTWVVVRHRNEGGESGKKVRERCPAPECGKEFEFEADETRVFEVPLPLFERRHFYGSELR